MNVVLVSHRARVRRGPSFVRFPQSKSLLNPRCWNTTRDETREDDSDVNEQRAKDVAEILSLSLSLSVILFARDFVRVNLDDAAAL